MAAHKGALTVGVVVVAASCIVAASKVMQYVKDDIREDYQAFYPMQSGARLEENVKGVRVDVDRLAGELAKFGVLQAQMATELGAMKRDDVYLAELMKSIQEKLK